MIKLTPEQLDDLEMSKSVMDEPRSGFQKLTDFLFGRTVPERMTNAFSTPLGSTQIAKVAPQIADTEMVSRALRAMGREALNYLRKTGQSLNVTRIPYKEGTLGNYFRGKTSHLVGLSPRATEATARHEITGHMFEDMLPPLTKSELQQGQQAIPTATHKRLMRMSGYTPQEIPGEAFAYGREAGAENAAPLSVGEVSRATDAARQTRKNLKAVMRNAFEDKPADVAEGVTKKQQGFSQEELQSFLGTMGPKVDPNADVFVKNAELLEKAKALSPTAAANREAARAALEARKAESSGFAALMEKQPWEVREKANLERMDAAINRMKKRTAALKAQGGAP